MMSENFPNLARDINPRSKMNRKETNPKKKSRPSRVAAKLMKTHNCTATLESGSAVSLKNHAQCSCHHNVIWVNTQMSRRQLFSDTVVDGSLVHFVKLRGDPAVLNSVSKRWLTTAHPRSSVSLNTENKRIGGDQEGSTSGTLAVQA